MNCCDYNCAQGRDCPARKPAPCPHCRGLGYDASGYPCTCTTPARVAKVGKRLHGPEPLRDTPWRRHMRHLVYWMLMAIIGLLMWSSIMLAVAYA